MAAAARAVLYQLQRFDAFILDALHSNLRRLAYPTASPQSEPFRSHNYDQNGELVSWTADGFRRIDISNADVIALQVAPWTFITSPYSYSLIIMAVLLNRIQHIVVPTHDSSTTRLGPWLSKLFPIDATATQTRFLLRSASLYLLWKSSIQLGTIVLQSFGVFPATRLLAPLGQWASASSMVDVCWSSFIAVCVAMAISTFTRGLDGSGPPTASFNLPQFAFLLHLYSSPLGNVFNRVQESYSSTPSRPNRHVLVTLFLPLLQMTMIHTQGVWMRHSRYVLIPTAVCGLLGLAHFIYTLSVGQIMEYPLLQVVPSSLELFLFLMILCTTGLNAISQILLQGRITRPLFGVGASCLPSLDEEYAVALVRLGTSSVDATSAAGLGNEVALLSSVSRQEGVVRLGPSGITSLELPNRDTLGRHRATNPWKVEIKHVRAVSAEGAMWINIKWMREMRTFGITLWRFLKGVWCILRGRSPDIEDATVSRDTIPAETPIRGQSRPLNRDVYQQFLAGEMISDDDSDFHEDDETITSSSSDAECDDCKSSYRSGMEPQDNIEETGQLYSDHGSHRASTPLAPVLLAHLTTPSGSPLTRRRYSSLLRRDDDEWSMMPSLQGSRIASRAESSQLLEDDDVEFGRRMCIICMSCERVVICWPCRCLSMCDDCRSNLASRNGPSKHTCPCCRQPVEGFSRIFIP